MNVKLALNYCLFCRRTLGQCALVHLESADWDGSHGEVVPWGGHCVCCQTPFHSIGAGLVGGVVQDLNRRQKFEIGHPTDYRRQTGYDCHAWKKANFLLSFWLFWCSVFRIYHALFWAASNGQSHSKIRYQMNRIRRNPEADRRHWHPRWQVSLAPLPVWRSCRRDLSSGQACQPWQSIPFLRGCRTSRRQR